MVVCVNETLLIGMLVSTQTENSAKPRLKIMRRSRHVILLLENYQAFGNFVDRVIIRDVIYE